jgi:adenylate cyclase
MADQGVERRLAAILAADVAGYSRLVGLDEEGTLARLRALRQNIIDPQIASHRGRIVKTTGDGLLVEFASVVDAVRCAVSVQRAVAEHENTVPEEHRIQFRVGINLGDIVVEGDDILGDGVNVAARLEGVAKPGGICIGAAAYEQVNGKVEVTFVDIGEQTLKNISRSIRAYRVMQEQLTHQSAVSAPLLSLPLPDKPSVAVLPFENMSGDPDQEYFADGMVEEIITALSRFRELFVIARNSTFTFKGKAVDVKQVGRGLGVRYVLEGSVRKGSGNRVRITAQLIEAETGAHLWADRFDGSLEDVFDLQDMVASNVAGIIGPTVRAAETVRSARRPIADLTAYDLHLRARALVSSSTGQGAEALRLVEQALALDPDYGPALGLAALCCQRVFALSGNEVFRGKAIDFARRALIVAGNDPGVLGAAAFALAVLGEDLPAMITLVDRALALNPNDASGWHNSGMFRCWAGQHAVAIEHLEKSLRLNPSAPPGFGLRQIGAAYFFSHRFAEAVPKLLSAIQVDPSHPLPYRCLAACYAHMGRLEEARDIVQRLRAVNPTVLRSNPYRRPEDRELLLSGLRLAMGETA